MLYLGMACSFCDIFQCKEGYVIIPLGMIIVIAGCIANYNKTIGYPALIISICMNIWPIIKINHFKYGFGVVWNRIARIIEMSLPYEVKRFTLDSALYNETICVSLFLIVLFMIVAILSIILINKNHWHSMIIVLVGYTLLQILLGISPKMIWNIWFYVSFILLIGEYQRRKRGICGRKTSKSIIIICIVLVGVISQFTHIMNSEVEYKGNIQITERADNVRKTIDDVCVLLFDPDKYEAKPDEVSENQNFMESFQQKMKSSPKMKSLSKIKQTMTKGQTNFLFNSSMLIIILLIIVLMIFLFMFYYRYRTRKQSENVNGCKTENEKICRVFDNLMDYLVAYGLEEKNQFLGEYKIQLKSMFSTNYANEYVEIVSLYQEAKYSNHKMEAKDYLTIKNYDKKLKDIASKQQNIIEKIKTKFKYYIVIKPKKYTNKGVVD